MRGGVRSHKVKSCCMRHVVAGDQLSKEWRIKIRGRLLRVISRVKNGESKLGGDCYVFILICIFMFVSALHIVRDGEMPEIDVPCDSLVRCQGPCETVVQVHGWPRPCVPRVFLLSRRKKRSLVSWLAVHELVSVSGRCSGVSACVCGVSGKCDTHVVSI
jgi:hypothetical protein